MNLCDYWKKFRHLMPFMLQHYRTETATYTHTHLFNGPLSGTTWVGWYQKGKSNLDFTEARDSEWQWHQLGHMQVCTSLQADNHTSIAPLSFIYRPDALPVAQPTASKHRNSYTATNLKLLHDAAESVAVCCR